MAKSPFRQRQEYVRTEEETALWQEFLASRDESLRLRLIDLHLPFARMLAAKVYSHRQGLEAPFEDYLHTAMLALIQSVDRFDPTLGIHFRVFAQYRIEGHILNEIPKLSEQHAQVNLMTRLRKERIESLSETQTGNRKSSKDSLFDEMVELAVGLSIGYMLEDYGMYCPEDRTDERDGYQIHAVKELRELLLKLVDLLPEKEKFVIKQHYFFGMGVEEIAQHMQLTKGRISQLHKKGLKGLKEMTETVGLNLNL